MLEAIRAYDGRQRARIGEREDSLPPVSPSDEYGCVYVGALKLRSWTGGVNVPQIALLTCSGVFWGSRMVS